MQRPRRYRWLTVSVFLIAYSVCQAARSAKAEDITIDKTEPNASPINLDTISSTKPAFNYKKEELEKTAKESENGENEEQKNVAGDYEEVIKEREPVEKDEPEEECSECAIPTVRPLRNCTPPAIEQFPRDLIPKIVRKYGGLIIHVLVAIYTFMGLAIVCDEYFVSSLYRISEELRIAPDVVGATFMAARSSVPELATVIIAVFCAKDDIGVSGVIGSAVFNLTFVISVCALCAGTVSHLNWWPLYRDCFFYAISILVMLYTIANGYVSWLESLCMLILYGVYCVALRFNSSLEAWALTLLKLPTRKEQAALVTYKSTDSQKPPVVIVNTTAGAVYTKVEGQTQETPHQNAPCTEVTYIAPYNNAGDKNQQARNQTWYPNQARGEQSISGVPAYYKAKEYNPVTAVDPLVRPTGANPLRMIYWHVTYPIRWTCRHTMPDCRGRGYPVTFIFSMLWISFYSYFMLWMITIIGFTLGIPDTVMGLTFVAAGVAVPDALSSLVVNKKGYGDMAVSNAVGSNVFNILVCHGLPWFMQTAIIHPGSHVNVISKGLIYSALILLSTVFLVVATHANGWKLDRKYGAVLMVWYLLFITFASLYELNIFGYFHPPECYSLY